MTTPPNAPKTYVDPRTDAERAAETEAAWAAKTGRERAAHAAQCEAMGAATGTPWTKAEIDADWVNLVGTSAGRAQPRKRG